MPTEPVLNDIMRDDEAFQEYFSASFPAYCTYCQYKFTFDQDIAKEIVQEAFIKLWVNRIRLSPDLPVRAYMNKIIVNSGLNLLKHEKYREKYRQYLIQNSSLHFSGEGFVNTDFEKLLADVNKAIAELPEQMQVIFRLSRDKELKYSEIAAQLQISVKTVETQMSRALQKLRIKLRHYLSFYIIITLVYFFQKNIF
jgi:RNA polymerase sigma-70 factor (ECF subfamily)